MPRTDDEPETFRTSYDDLLELAESLFGGDAAEQVKKAQQTQRSRAARDLVMARKIKRTFATQHGRDVLDWMKSFTVAARPLSIEEVEADPPHTRDLRQGWRLGMNEIVLRIEAAIAEATPSENGGEEE
jgi:hypothetical protein